MSRIKFVGLPQRVLVIMIAFVGSVAATVSAQRFRLPEGYQVPPRFPPAGFSDGAFTHCKIMYESVRREANGMGWGTDYPFAGIHLMIRVSDA